MNGSFLIRNVSLWFFAFIDLTFIGSPSGAGFSRREWGGTFISRVWIFLFCSWERASLGSMDSQDDSISTSARASLLTNVSGSDISWVYNITNTWFHIQHCYIPVCLPSKKPLRFPISQRQIGKMNQERPSVRQFARDPIHQYVNVWHILTPLCMVNYRRVKIVSRNL